MKVHYFNPFRWAEGGPELRIRYPFAALPPTFDCTVADDGRVFAHDLEPDRHDLLVASMVDSIDMLGVWQALNRSDAPAHIIDYDDLPFEMRDYSKPGLSKLCTPKDAQVIRTAMYLSDALTVSTPMLAHELSRYNPHVFVLPNALPTAYLEPPVPPSAPPGRAIVGWGGSPSHVHDMAMISETLSQVIDGDRLRFRSYGTDFTTMQAGAAKPVLSLPNVEHVGVQRYDAYLRSLGLDIGLCPLADTRFNQSKSPVKALEYAFRGIPAICSPTVYADFIVHGETGFIAETPEQWAAYIELLANDPRLRHQIATNAFDQAREHWTTEAHAQRRADIYDNIVANAKKWRRVRHVPTPR